jgi:casein kinase 1
MEKKNFDTKNTKNSKKKCKTQEYNVVGNHYILRKQIGSGSFGEVFQCIRRSDNRVLAAKTENYVEDKGVMKKCKLLLEKNIYRHLYKNNVKHIPKIYGYFQGSKPGHSHVMIMSLLGESLDKIFENCGNKLNLGSVLKLSVDLISIMKRIHDAGIIHRDIKPNNFMIGKNNKSYVYIMDFGLSKKYVSKTGKHMPYSTGRTLIGTPRYSGLNVHMGLEPSRRDDLESIGYMLIYFAKGELPWQGLRLPKSKQCEDKNKNKERKLNQIYYVKKTTSLQKLCEGLPSCFVQYLEYVKKLTFTVTPDYEYLINLFLQCAKEEKISLKYEWDMLES